MIKYVEIKSYEFINKSNDKIDNKKTLKNSKKFSFCKVNPFDIITDDSKQNSSKQSFTTRPPSSFKNKKFGKNPWIFKFNNKKNKQNTIKKNCTKNSLSIKGKLKLILFINLALKTSCKSIDIERKISGINDLKTMPSIYML